MRPWTEEPWIKWKQPRGTKMDVRRSSSQRPVKNVGHKRAGPSSFFFSQRIARMNPAEPGFTIRRGARELWKWWSPRRRRKAKAMPRIAKGYAYTSDGDSKLPLASSQTIQPHYSFESLRILFELYKFWKSWNQEHLRIYYRIMLPYRYPIDRHWDFNYFYNNKTLSKVVLFHLLIILQDFYGSKWFEISSTYSYWKRFEALHSPSLRTQLFIPSSLIREKHTHSSLFFFYSLFLLLRFPLLDSFHRTLSSSPLDHGIYFNGVSTSWPRNTLSSTRRESFEG